MLMQAIKEWTAVCTSSGHGKSIAIKIRFRGDVPNSGERIPLPAGFCLYANGRKHIGAVVTEQYVEASVDDLETVAAWLPSLDGAAPSNIVSYEVTRRNWKVFPRR